MRKFSKVIDMTDNPGKSIQALRDRVEEGIDFLRKAQENINDHVVFAGTAQELSDVVKDISIALTGRNVIFDERDTVNHTLPNEKGEYEADDLRCPKCRSCISVNKPGSYDCSGCGSSLFIDALPRIGSKDSLSIIRFIPGNP